MTDLQQAFETLRQKHYKGWDGMRRDSNPIYFDWFRLGVEWRKSLTEKPVKKSLEERKADFYHELKKLEHGYEIIMISEFYLYWTETKVGGTKMRWEKERTFDIKRRLERWARNQKTNFGRTENLLKKAGYAQ